MKTIVRRTANVLAVVLTVISVALAVFVLVSRAKGETPFIGGKSLMWVMTDSMNPTIREKSYIVVEEVSASDINVDDVIVYISDDPEIAGMKNTHRVVEIIGDHEEFVTKGDNNQVNDKYNAKADKIVARYVKTLPFLSGIGRLFSNAVSISALCIVFITILFILLIPENAALKKRLKPDIEQITITGIIPPRAGEKPCGARTAPEDAPYVTEELKWIRSDTAAVVGESDVFAEGASYSVCVTVHAKQGHSFADECKAKLDGANAGTQHCGDKIIVMFAFPATETSE